MDSWARLAFVLWVWWLRGSPLVLFLLQYLLVFQRCESSLVEAWVEGYFLLQSDWASGNLKTHRLPNSI